MQGMDYNLELDYKGFVFLISADNLNNVGTDGRYFLHEMIFQKQLPPPFYLPSKIRLPFE